MDQAIRNKLRNVVTQCRKLLEEAISQEFEGKYGIFARKDQVTADPNARMSHLSDEEQAARKDILDHFAHIKARGFKPKEALDQLVREIAFTHLNRLCAYKMMEAREVYVGGQKFREAVSRGVNSNGVKFYLADHEEDERLFNTGHQDVAYRHFLDWLGGTLSNEIGVLFNPNDPANRLYPRQKTLDEVLDLLNGGGIKAEETELREQWPQIWSQDETIGWVYQYFTPKELRDQARKESQAPRNSYELAFRNQFFTPRYVVEFLTDNTLGRIWYEMRKGDTKLKDQCRYMVRRPTEIFLKEGEQQPSSLPSPSGRGAGGEGERDDLSQEELLKLPVYIPHRPKKDPRELKILDPACGSGHFLLYCFDLLLTIYEETHTDPDLGPALQKDYPTLEDLWRHTPRLILAHNLHGIDIDLRASQIAALALWLRCQRAYQELGLKKDRPKITRSNFVCAEPMPGEESMLKEFVGQLEPKILGQVVEVVFDKMKLAGEAGSLLKIEEEIRDAVAAAKKQWVRETAQAMDRKGQPLLFTEGELDQLDRKPQQPSLFDFSDLTDAQFFEQAESRVIEALRSYAEKAQNGQRLQRRLFTEDAVRGFAFVDLCQKRYDVVLMNPPFGEPSNPSQSYIASDYPATKNDTYSAFVERGLGTLCESGRLGAITSRTGFFLSVFKKWREEILLASNKPVVIADLGYGVLDSAMVETAAYCIEKGVWRDNFATFFRLVAIPNKDASLQQAIGGTSAGCDSPLTHVVNPTSFCRLPGSPFAYWVTEKVRTVFETCPSLGSIAIIDMGMSTKNDFRFVRLRWEVSPAAIGWDKEFRFYAKGGDSVTSECPINTVINSRDNFADLKQELLAKYPYLNGNTDWVLHPEYHYGEVGLTFGRRVRRFSPLPLPKGIVFSDSNPTIFPVNANDLYWLASFLSSRVVRSLLGLMAPARKMEVGYVASLPIPLRISQELTQRMHNYFVSRYQQRRLFGVFEETHPLFCVPKIIGIVPPGMKDREEDLHDEMLDNLVGKAYGLIDSDIAILVNEAHVVSGLDGLEKENEDSDEEDKSYDANTSHNEPHDWAALISYAIGVAVGRWDVRYAIGKRKVPELPDPFAQLPACPPGMLQGLSDNALMLEVPNDYPICAARNGILVDSAEHDNDVVRRVRQVFELILKDLAEANEKEGCEVLGVKELRDYFRKAGKGGFWDDHISRYSKSRRKAPIYWLLQSSKKNYALWLYYHRLDKDLLFKALVNYVEPKIRLESSRLETLRNQKTTAGESGKEAKRLAKDMERQEDFLSELRDFEDKLRRAANLHLEPDLNDGVVLNIAPLHELVPWKEARNYWDELLAGKYEWSSTGKQLREKGLVTC